MKGVCSNPDLLTTDPACRKWVRLSPDAAYDTMKSVCSNSKYITSDACKEWCAKNPTACDQAVINWCSLEENANNPYCSCINSKINTPKYGINPLCVDSQCLQYGYATANMRTAECPSIINCDIIANLNSDGISIGTTVPIQQNCSSITGVSPSTPSTPSVPITSTTTLSPTIILFLLFVFIIIISLLAYSFGIFEKISSYYF
jgi:hypothetical protein